MGVALVATASPCRADGAGVEVRCAELSSEDAAEVEARVRATLLSEPTANTEVAIRCEPGGATVTVATGGLLESTTVPATSGRFEDDLVAAVERTLAALKSRRESASAAFPEERPPAARPAAPSRGPETGDVPPAPERTPLETSPSVAWRLGGSGAVERWSDRFAFGGRLHVETSRAPWALGFAFGVVTGPERARAFVPAEWHALAFAAWDAPLFGLRATAGAGVSLLTVSPSPGLVTRTGDSLASAFGELGVSRPIRLGRLSIVPGLALRAFGRPRSVLVDGSERLSVPVLVPLATLGATVEL